MNSLIIGNCRVSLHGLHRQNLELVTKLFHTDFELDSDLKPFSGISKNLSLEESIAILVETARDSHSKNMYLHSSTLVKGKRCIMLVGPSFGGKTTLTTALALTRNWKVLSEDLSIFDESEAHVIPYCIPLSIREGGWRLLQNLSDWKQIQLVKNRWLASVESFSQERGRAPSELWFLKSSLPDAQFKIEELGTGEFLRTIVHLTNALYAPKHMEIISSVLENAKLKTIENGSLEQRLDLVDRGVY
ncbi:MAG: hypothetical protein K2X27_19285 [Candidatus Obscuribacterales bacterium]|nr:hypothetical protein [Candidatus Obscuribacterales bacterium]